MKPKIGRRKFLKRAGLAGLGALGLAGGCAKMGLGIKGPTAPPPEAQGLLSREAESLYWPHGGPGKWFNPWWPNPGSRVNLYKWKFLYRNEFAEIKNAKTPEIPVVSNDGAYLAKPQNEPSITSIGHCGFIIQDGPSVVLADPHFGAGAFWHGRHQPPGVPAASIPGGAAALISHNHYDHLDSWTIENLPEDVTWFVPMGLGAFVESLGRRAVELDWWRSAEHGDVRLTCLPAQHWSNRFGMARDSTLWCSWLVETGGRKYYHGGDSGYFQGFREFGRKFGPIDVAMLPIGAYEPRWMMRYSHMNPAEGLRAFHELGARWMIPMHWGTFDLTDEPLDHPPRVLEAHMAETGADASRVRVMAVGERWRFL